MKKQKLDFDQDNITERRSETPGNNIEDLLIVLEEVDAKLMEIDKECAREQMAIQRRFDEKKKPIFDERKVIIGRIPRFWSETISKHPVIQENLQPEDLEILEYLKDIELDDNLDDEGSYRIKFIFEDSVSKYMEPNVLIKHIVYQDNGELVKEVTKIKWKKESPRSLIKKRLMDDIQNFEDQEVNVFSFFDFFTEGSVDENIDIGDILRRDIFHAPLLYYCGEENS